MKVKLVCWATGLAKYILCVKAVYQEIQACVPGYWASKVHFVCKSHMYQAITYSFFSGLEQEDQ